MILTQQPAPRLRFAATAHESFNMTAITIHALDSAFPDPWDAVVAQTHAWADAAKIELRDAVLLLSISHHLPLARLAWARTGGWMPRIETVQSLARSLPCTAGEDIAAGQISFDVAIDRLQAARMLRAQTWAHAADPRAFDLAAASLVDTAHALARAAACVEPSLRAAQWEHARALFAQSASNLGQRERLLCRVAVEWAAACADPSTDRLFALHPSAWICVQAGGADALVQRLMAAAKAPALCIDADAPLATAPLVGHHRTAVCDHFEDEAQRTAAAVIASLNQGRSPVALIAQDRALIRRTRALLDRQAIPVRDETGWKLSTTRAAASLHSLLACAAHDASADACLDCLKTTDANASAVDALERAWRRFGVKQARQGDLDALTSEAQEVLRQALQAVDPLTERSQRTLAVWLDVLRLALRQIGLWAGMQADEAGRQVLDRLGLTSEGGPTAFAFQTEALPLQAFTDWVDATLESASFIPASQTDAPVIITPLSQALLRPFAAVIFPGADSKHLGAVPTTLGLLSEAEALALGVPTREEKRQALGLAFAQLCQQPEVTFLRRVDDGGDPLTVSPLLAQWTLKAARAGVFFSPAEDARSLVDHPAAPVPRPSPQAPGLLPPRLSASACEALRACPYRFFALRMLKLNAVDELDTELEKRDYGTWLHAVLHRFHLSRSEPALPEDEAYALHQAAALQTEASALDEAEFLPYRASFARFVPRYVAWLHERDGDGARWLDGERKLGTQPPAWKDIKMEGVIDRVDSQAGQEGPLTQLIDYKTGQAAALRAAVKQGEDTQLPYYAALMAAQGEAAGEIAAAYWFLDESDRIIELNLPDVQASAELLVQGVGNELQRIREGAPLPALGEGRSCDFCDARGLCRKDYWASEDLMVGDDA
jgi:ATP-dependent helicase/nuclease subunit B